MPLPSSDTCTAGSRAKWFALTSVGPMRQLSVQARAAAPSQCQQVRVGHMPIIGDRRHVTITHWDVFSKFVSGRRPDLATYRSEDIEPRSRSTYGARAAVGQERVGAGLRCQGFTRTLTTLLAPTSYGYSPDPVAGSATRNPYVIDFDVLRNV